MAGPVLQTYQEEYASLSVRSMQMYEMACQHARMGAVHNILQKQREFDHLLLHMILSDIQSITLRQASLPTTEVVSEFRTCSLELVRLMLHKKIGSSQHVLETWLTKVSPLLLALPKFLAPVIDS